MPKVWLNRGPLAIQTYYEGKHLADGRTIYFVSFSLPETPITLPDRQICKITKIEDIEETEELFERHIKNTN